MKKFILLAVFTAIFFTGFAQQMPNGSFENWTSPNTVAGWTSAEDLAGALVVIDTSIFTFKDTISFTQGSASVKLVTDTVNGYTQFGIITGVLSLGTGFINSSLNPQFIGVPFTFRPDSVIFDYQMSSPGVDTSYATISLTKKTSPIIGYQGSGGLGYPLVMSANWTHVALEITPYYFNSDYPDTLLLQFVSSGTNNPIIGTTLHVDGLRFGYVNAPVSVQTSGPTALCSSSGGDSVTFQASTGSNTGYSYQWNVGGAPISGATNASFTTGQSGTYTVSIDSSTSSGTSQPLIVSVDNTMVSLNEFNDTICSNAHAFSLHSASPAGGVYSGSGVTAATFTPAAAALGLDTIKYAVTDQYGCAKSGYATVFIDVCTGINNVSSTELSIYPNPATTLLNVNSTASMEGFNLQMFDLLGRTVLNQILEANTNAISISKLGNGTYIYRITDKESNVVSQSKFDVIK